MSSPTKSTAPSTSESDDRIALQSQEEDGEEEQQQDEGTAPSVSESHSDLDSGGSDDRVALQSEEEEEEGGEEEQQQDEGKEEGRNRGQVAKKEGEDPMTESHSNGDAGCSKRRRVDEGKEVETEVRRAAPLKLGFDEGERKQCPFPGGNSEAMASTSHCHPHISSDNRQTLFKPCIFVIEKSENGEHITCATPIPVDTMPSLCVPHKQEYDRSIVEALANAGLDISSSTNPSRLFTAIINEFTRVIQTRRRALKAARDAMAQKELPDKRQQRDEEDKD